MVDSIPFSMSRFWREKDCAEMTAWLGNCLEGWILWSVVATGMDAALGCGTGGPLDHLVELPAGSDPGELLDIC
ncbi:hypothetical protein D8674_023002 [Pyrus ussuriensis x Pyrus communis]|uniref:Uncharacterized protein n=1 Tax=Pyrus ussuriensis x Pyrus communis TaxID=2448454 RepID=A0A5N5H049_9ROSA|nr:hypothetical protein D8674_023002 [Pyrus ussuriensis x Pyrus communis]